MTDVESPTPTPVAARRRLHGQRGAALLEFALVFGLFVFVLYALIAFGMVLALKQSMTNAASDGARAAVGAVPASGETLEAAQVRVARAKVDGALGWLGSNRQPNVDIPDPTYCTGSSGPKCITVTLTYPYKDKPLVPPAPGLGVFVPDSIKTAAVVQVTS